MPTRATVAGYDCQRATAVFGGRTWEAWFAREVPIPEGPYKFYGLPGLIVKVADIRGQFAFELIKLRQVPKPLPLGLPEAGAKPVTKAEFTKGKMAYASSQTAQMLASGNIRFNTSGDEEKFRQNTRNNAKKPTNPIELK